MISASDTAGGISDSLMRLQGFCTYRDRGRGRRTVCCWETQTGKGKVKWADMREERKWCEERKPWNRQKQRNKIVESREHTVRMNVCCKVSHWRSPTPESPGIYSVCACVCTRFWSILDCLVSLIITKWQLKQEFLSRSSSSPSSCVGVRWITPGNV